MNAIKNEIQRRVEEMAKYSYDDPYRIATINLLEDIANSVDFMQKQTQAAYKSIEWYNNQFNMIATTKIRYHIWEIKKAALTRLQDRYRKTLELLYKTR